MSPLTVVVAIDVGKNELAVSVTDASHRRHGQLLGQLGRCDPAGRRRRRHLHFTQHHVLGEESARIKAVARYEILDTSPDVAFDRVAAIAARLFAVQMATVCIVDSDRIWFKASLGLADVQEVSREPGLGAFVSLQDEPYLVTHARTDPRTSAHSFVTGEMGLQFFASAPIITADGQALGSVSVMDTEPHDATPEQLEMLADLAAVVMDQLEIRLIALNALRDGR